MKKCNRCKEEKYLIEYSKDRKAKDGLRGFCKNCEKARKKAYYLSNKKKLIEIQKKYVSENREKVKQTQQNYYLKNKDRLINSSKENAIKNKENRKIYIREYMKNRRDNDPLFKLRGNIRTLIKNSVLRQSKSIGTKNILGISTEDFKIYIEQKFLPWMNWENYGKCNGQYEFGWDLDHIIPISSAKTQEEILSLNHYTNFQPLCSKINRDEKINR